MLSHLVRLIHKHPWSIILTMMIFTIGFSILIPSIEFKTDFEDFSPDDELVRADKRIESYFGGDEQIVFLRIKNHDGGNILDPESIRELDFLRKNLNKLPDVTGSFSLLEFLQIICFIEFGKNLENCSDEEISTALIDLLKPSNEDNLQILPFSDPDEPIDFNRFPRISKGISVESTDIKNYRLLKKDDNLSFIITVYNLDDLKEIFRPIFPRANVVEWYISFKNMVYPFKDIGVEYKIAAHIEPKYPLWEIGKGFLRNLRELFNHIRNHELFDIYRKNVYIWIKLPDQQFSIPILIEKGNVTFDSSSNSIKITVPLKELARYGIAPEFDGFSLPAKLSMFSAGFRYYQTPCLKLPGGRIVFNTSYLSAHLFKLQSKPLIGEIAGHLLQKYSNLTWQDIDKFYEMLQQSDMLPDKISLQNIESTWRQGDRAPDTHRSNTIFFITPSFYEDLRIISLSFLSRDYRDMDAESTIFFLLLQPTKDYDKIIEMNTNVINALKDIKLSNIKVDATGNGVVSKELNDLTSQANKIIAPSIFIIIMIVLFLNFRRPSYVILPMLTLVVSTIWLFGCMALFGISFNVIFVAIVPLIFGLGVDYSIHLFHNYRVELENGRTPAEAIENSVREIGTAMFLAMLTTVIAFLSFLTATVPSVRNLGILLAFGVIFTFITALTLLPSLRYILDQRKTIHIKSKPKKLIARKLMGILSTKILIHQKKIILAMVIISIIFAAGAVKIKTGFDIKQFAPSQSPAYELFDEIAEDFPFSSQNQEYILIEGDVATVKALEGIYNTLKNIEDDPFVARNTDGSLKVTSIYSFIQQAIKENKSLIEKFHMVNGIPKTDRDVKALYDYLYNQNITYEPPSFPSYFANININITLPSNFNLDSFKGNIKSVLYKEDGQYKASLIRVYIKPGFIVSNGNISKQREILKEDLNKDISDYGNAKGIATGQNIISYTITNSLTESQITSTMLSIILAAIILIIVYRDILLGLISLIPVSISIVWVLGTMYYIGYTLNALTITVTSITIGIGIDYAIHAVERFRLIADRTGDISRSVRETIAHTGGALLIAALTTVLGFIILVLAPIPPQQQFGFILAVTITYSFLTSIFLLPLVLYRWAKWRKKIKGYIVSPSNE